MKNILIIAPHIDDELIGCWSLFCNPDNRISIVWLYEITDVRRREAVCIDLSRRIKAEIDLTAFGEESVAGIIKECNPKEVYVTSRKDGHLDHKKANALFRKYATHFYSVDMVDATYIGEEESKYKRATLDALFPSQKALWKGNAKYYLFEAISRCDFDSNRVITHKEYIVTVPSFYYSKCLEAVREEKWSSSINLMNLLLEICPTGKVTIESYNEILSSEG